MRKPKSIIINSLAALVLVAAGYMLGQVFPADTATADELYTSTKLTGNLKVQQRDKVHVFVDGAQRFAHCGFASGCTGGGATVKVHKIRYTSNGNIEYSISQ